MAMNWEKFSKPVERRKPIIFLINESVSKPGSTFSSNFATDGNCRERSMMQKAFSQLISNIRKNNIRADVAVITFGSTVNLLLPYTDVTQIQTDVANKIAKLPKANAAVFGTGLLAVKEYLEDLDETPKHIYRPTVILMTSNEPSQGWESCLETFLKDGRSSKCQRFAIYTPYDGERTELFENGKTLALKVSEDDMIENTLKSGVASVAESGLLSKNLVAILNQGGEVTNKNGEIKSKAVKAFAEKGAVLKCDPTLDKRWSETLTQWLSFDELDEEAPMVEVEKPEDDIPVLEDADFDGNNLDEDSYI